MNKKFLSAILFGALMVTSTGTFVSCKDYDDDIDEINGKIDKIETTLSELESKIGDKGVTSVTFDEKTGVLTVVDGTGTKTYTIKMAVPEVDEVIITVDGKDLKVDGKVVGQVGDTVEVKDGELTINGAATGIKVGQYAIITDKNAQKVTIKLPNAEGVMEEITLPIYSASSAITSLKLAQAAQTLKAPFAFAANDAQMKNIAGTEWAKKAVVSTYNADGTKGCYVDVVIEPTNVATDELTFTLQNSKGVTVFANGVVTEAPTLQAKAASSTGVYRIYFAYKDGLTKDDLNGDNAIIKAGDALAVVCGNVSTSYDLKNDYGTTSTTDSVTAQSDTWVKLGDTYNIFAKEGFNTDPSLGTASEQGFLTAFAGVTDYKLSVDETIASTYGVTVSGSSFTIANELAYNKEIPLTLTYTSDATTGTTKPATVTITVKVQTEPVVGAVTLKASHVLTTDAKAKYAYIPLADLANSITGENKIEWNKATSLSYKTVVDNAATGKTMTLTSAKKYGSSPDYLSIAGGDELTIGDVVKADKTTKAANLSEAAYIKVEVDPAKADVTADVYSGLIEFTFGGKTANATVELTLTNPTAIDAAAISRIPVYFKGDNLAAYGTVASSNLTYDVTKAYNIPATTTATAHGFKVTNKETKAGAWVVSATTVTIPLADLYKDTQEFEVEYQLFAGATYNVHKEKVLITGQSPIKDGTITVSKTELDLTDGEDTFVSADVAGKDAFGVAYKLLNSFKKETGADKKDAKQVDEMSADIKSITFDVADDNKGAFTVTPVYKKIDDGKLVDGIASDNTELTGWTIKFNSDTAISNGATIKFNLNITDAWGVELPAKEVTLKVTGLSD